MACHVPREHTFTDDYYYDRHPGICVSPYYHVLMRTVNVHTTPFCMLCFLVMSRSLHA